MKEISDKDLLEDLARRRMNEISSLHAMEQAIKRLMNSLYGAQANPHFRYFNSDIAEGITMTGQMIIQYAEKRMNKFLDEKFGTSKDRVVMIDTDSLMVNLSDFYRKVVGDRVIKDKHKIIDVLDSFCKKDIVPKLDEWFSELSEYLNVFEPRLRMKREKIIDSGIWRAKKNYIIQVWDNEGVRYTEPKMVPVGIEIARSSTPGEVKGALRKAISIMLNHEEADLIKYIETFRTDFNSLPLAQISFPRGVTDLEKWEDPSDVWKKGAPIHVKGSLVYNNLIAEKRLPLRTIHSGDKIKFIYLKTPNPTRCNVISFHEYLPEEFALENYVDKSTQFNKTFLQPVTSFTEIIGWKTENEVSLNDFFSCDSGEPSARRKILTGTENPCKIHPEVRAPSKKKKPVSVEGFF